MKNLICVYLGIIFSIHSSHAVGNDTLVNRQIILDEIIIQSFKQNKDFKELPVSASVITTTAIRNREITGLRDFSAFIPNFFIPDYGSKLTTSVYIRGVGSKLNSPSTGLYVDGIPYFEKASFDFDFTGIDHVEVLRGPQGTLYGRNTIGGLINIYTSSPLRKQQTHLSFTSGNYGLLNTTASWSGKIKENMGLSISGNYNHIDGYFINKYNGEKVDPSDEGSGRIRYDWMIRPNLTFRIISSLEYLDQGGYPYGILDTEAGKIGEVNYNRYSDYIRTLSTSGASIEYIAEKYSLNNQLSFQYLSDEQGLDQDFSAQDAYYVVNKQKQKMVSNEFNIKSTTQSLYQWLFGAFLFRQKMNSDITINTIPSDALQQNIYEIPTYGIAFYHQSTLNRIFIDGLSASVGIRYDFEHASLDFNQHMTISGDKTSSYTDGSSGFSQVTPKFCLQYLTPSDQLIYGSVTRGYKSGGFNSSPGLTEDQQTFDPEYSWNYEIGSKINLWDKRIHAEAALFYIDWKDFQAYQSIPGVGQILHNAGRSESKGVELSMQGNLFNGFIAQASYGYTHAKYKEFNYSETVDYSGRFIPLVPRHTLSIGADYTLTNLKGTLDLLTFSLNYTGAGKIYWTDSNEQAQSFYGLLNAKVSVTKGILTGSIWAKNITNKEYATYAFMLNNWMAQKGKPFTIGANIAITF